MQSLDLLSPHSVFVSSPPPACLHRLENQDLSTSICQRALKNKSITFPQQVSVCQRRGEITAERLKHLQTRADFTLKPGIGADLCTAQLTNFPEEGVDL